MLANRNVRGFAAAVAVAVCALGAPATAGAADVAALKVSGQEAARGVTQVAIGIDLIHYHGRNVVCMVTPADVQDANHRQTDGYSRARYLDRDHSLCSGLINPAGQQQPLTSDPVLDDLASSEIKGTPGIGFRFQQPIVNSAGPDVVLFELQR